MTLKEKAQQIRDKRELKIKSDELFNFVKEHEIYEMLVKEYDIICNLKWVDNVVNNTKDIILRMDISISLGIEQEHKGTLLFEYNKKSEFVCKIVPLDNVFTITKHDDLDELYLTLDMLLNGRDSQHEI